MLTQWVRADSAVCLEMQLGVYCTSGRKFVSGDKYDDDDFDLQTAYQKHGGHNRGGEKQPRYYRLCGSVLSVVAR
jgi:hypothetical protein